MIARARDDRPQAREYFARARDLNPLLIPARWLRWLEDDRG
jgi:hypothetical protein